MNPLNLLRRNESRWSTDTKAPDYKRHRDPRFLFIRGDQAWFDVGIHGADRKRVRARGLAAVVLGAAGELHAWEIEYCRDVAAGTHRDRDISPALAQAALDRQAAADAAWASWCQQRRVIPSRTDKRRRQAIGWTSASGRQALAEAEGIRT